MSRDSICKRSESTLRCHSSAATSEQRPLGPFDDVAKMGNAHAKPLLITFRLQLRQHTPSSPLALRSAGQKGSSVMLRAASQRSRGARYSQSGWLAHSRGFQCGLSSSPSPAPQNANDEEPLESATPGHPHQKGTKVPGRQSRQPGPTYTPPGLILICGF